MHWLKNLLKLLNIGTMGATSSTVDTHHSQYIPNHGKTRDKTCDRDNKTIAEGCNVIVAPILPIFNSSQWFLNL